MPEAVDPRKEELVLEIESLRSEHGITIADLAGFYAEYQERIKAPRPYSVEHLEKVQRTIGRGSLDLLQRLRDFAKGLRLRPPRDASGACRWLLSRIQPYYLSLSPKFSKAGIPAMLAPGDVTVKVAPEALDKMEGGEEHRDGRCRLVAAEWSEEQSKLSLTFGETTYSTFRRRMLTRAFPSIQRTGKTSRDDWEDEVQSKAEKAERELFTAPYSDPNIAGVGLMVYDAREGTALFSKRRDDSAKYPGALSYTTSGSMSFGSYPSPYGEAAALARGRLRVAERLPHQVDPCNTCMVHFGADTTYCYFQFSFAENYANKRHDLGRFSAFDRDGHRVPLEAISLLPAQLFSSKYLTARWEPSALVTAITLSSRIDQKHFVEAVCGLSDLDIEQMRRACEWGMRAVTLPCPDLSPRYVAHYLDVHRNATRDSESDREAIWRWMEKEGKNYAEFVVQQVAQSLQDGSRRNKEFQGKQVVDVGAGTGRVSTLLASRGIHVTAIEANDWIAARLHERIQKAGPSATRIKVVEQDALDYFADLGAKRFDLAVLSLFAIHQSDEAVSCLAKHLHRTCGRIILCEHVIKSRQNSRATFLRPVGVLLNLFAAAGWKPVTERPQNHELVGDQILCWQLVPLS